MRPASTTLAAGRTTITITMSNEQTFFMMAEGDHYDVRLNQSLPGLISGSRIPSFISVPTLVLSDLIQIQSSHDR